MSAPKITEEEGCAGEQTFGPFELNCIASSGGDSAFASADFEALGSNARATLVLPIETVRKLELFGRYGIVLRPLPPKVP